MNGQSAFGRLAFLFADKTGEKLMKFFDEDLPPPANCKLLFSDDKTQGLQTNVTATCYLCKEEIAIGDRIDCVPLLTKDMKGIEADRVHGECRMARVFGTVGHQAGKCFCFGGTKEDPPGLTKRESAIASVLLYFGQDKFKRMFPKLTDINFEWYYKAIVDVTTEPLIPKSDEPNI